MKIAIIGAGALGSVYGSFLSIKNNDIVLITRRQEQAETINKEGILIRYKNKNKRYHPRASMDPSSLADRDLFILLVKTYDLNNVSDLLLKYSRNDSIILSLLNGLGNVETLSFKCGMNRILAGVSYIGAQKISDTQIEIGGVLKTVMGEPSGFISDRLSRISFLFKDAGFDTYLSNDINRLLWEKMVITTSQNALSAITGFTIGQMHSSQYCRFIILQLLDELTKVAAKEGIELPRNLLERVLENSKALPNHHGSMWQDLQAGHRTEIDAINGAIVELGQKHGLPTPYNEFITYLMHVLEKKTS